MQKHNYKDERSSPSSKAACEGDKTDTRNTVANISEDEMLIDLLKKEEELTNKLATTERELIQAQIAQECPTCGGKVT